MGGENEVKRPTWLGPLLLFGSPVLAVGLLCVLAVFHAVAPLAFFPYTTLFYLLAWVAGSVLAAIGSAAGGALTAGSPRSWWRWSPHVSAFIGFFAGAVAYAVLSVIPYVLLVMYVLVFGWV